jgi:hypothetical protein
VKLYVASSWRNEQQPLVVRKLRQLGHEVYDFHQHDHEPNNWENIAEDGEAWTPEQYIEALNHPVAEHDFNADFQAMQWADAVVLLYPCGRSAHLEAGWAAGAQKMLYIVLTPDIVPDLMVKMADLIFPSIDAFYEHISET